MKKLLILLGVLVLFISFSGFAFAADFEGKVTKVRGKVVTIKITDGKASDLEKGMEVKIKSDGAPKKSSKKKGRLMGC